MVRGDVAIHIRQRDWDSHGHGHDRGYNGVVLHAALEVESPTTVLQNGQQAPVVSLAPLLDGEDPPDSGPSTGLWDVLGRRGYHQPDSPGEMGALLDRAGDNRFLAWSASFTILLQEQEPEQTLYEALLRAAAVVPREQRVKSLESWLLLQSGFPPLVPGSDKVPRLVGFGRALMTREWHCFRVRPPNHPRHRIAGAAALLERFLEYGLLRGLMRAAASGSPKDLTSAMTVGGSPGRYEALIGQSRARDLAVNVVLPFCYGLAQSEPNGDQGQSFLDLYQRFGKLQENELTREMADQLLEPAWTGIVSNARRQQGLLHLHSQLAGAS